MDESDREWLAALSHLLAQAVHELSGHPAVQQAEEGPALQGLLQGAQVLAAGMARRSPPPPDADVGSGARGPRPRLLVPLASPDAPPLRPASFGVRVKTEGAGMRSLARDEMLRVIAE